MARTIFCCCCALLVLPLAAQGGPPPAAPVVVAEVVREQVAQQVGLTATVEASRRSRIAALRSGLVTERLVEVGDRLAAGATLFRLDEELLQAELAAARARRDSARVSRDQARREAQRSEALLADQQIPQQTHEQNEYTLAAATERLAEAEADLQRLAVLHGRSRITAPFAGTVNHLEAEIGEWLTPGSVVAELLDLAVVDIRVPVPERYAHRLRPEQEVLVTASSRPEKQWRGSIYRMLPAADRSTRTVPVLVRVDNAAGGLTAGLLCRVRLNLDEARDELLVPKDALTFGIGGEVSVWQVIDGSAVPTPVERLGVYGDRAAVAGELQPGAQVVTRGNERLRPGQAVRIVDGHPEAPARNPEKNSANGPAGDPTGSPEEDGAGNAAEQEPQS